MSNQWNDDQGLGERALRAVQVLYLTTASDQAGSDRIVSVMRAIEAWLKEEDGR